MRKQYRNKYKHQDAPYSYNDDGSRRDYHKWYYWNVIKKNDNYSYTFTRQYGNIIVYFD